MAKYWTPFKAGFRQSGAHAKQTGTGAEALSGSMVTARAQSPEWQKHFSVRSAPCM